MDGGTTLCDALRWRYNEIYIKRKAREKKSEILPFLRYVQHADRPELAKVASRRSYTCNSIIGRRSSLLHSREQYIIHIYIICNYIEIL